GDVEFADRLARAKIEGGFNVDRGCAGGEGAGHVGRSSVGVEGGVVLRPAQSQKIRRVTVVGDGAGPADRVRDIEIVAPVEDEERIVDDRAGAERASCAT